MKITGKIVLMDIRTKMGQINGGSEYRPSVVPFKWNDETVEEALMTCFFDHDLITVSLDETNNVILVS